MRSTPARESSSPDSTTCRTSVQCALAPDPARRAARPVGAGGFVLFLALVLLLAGLSACEDNVDIAPPKASTDSTGQHAEGAQQALEDLVHAVATGSREQAEETAASGSRDLLGSVYDNAKALHVGELSMRYVDETAPLDQHDQVELGPGAWRGTVQMTYRYDGFDPSPARLETTATFVPAGGRVRIASFGGGEARTPLWLVERLSVVRTSRTLLAVAAASPGRYSGLVTRAVRQVTRVLPDW